MAPVDWMISSYFHVSLLCVFLIPPATQQRVANGHPHGPPLTYQSIGTPSGREKDKVSASRSSSRNLGYGEAIRQPLQRETPKFQLMTNIEFGVKQSEEEDLDTMKSSKADDFVSANIPSTTLRGSELFVDKPTSVLASYKDMDLDVNLQGDKHLCGPNDTCTCITRNHGLRSNCSYQHLNDFPAPLPENVASVNAANNQISNLCFTSFVNYNLLKEVDLSYNRLTDISSTGVESQSTLEIINLSHNFIKDLKNGQFKALTNLIRLYLSVNLIVFIGPTALEGMAKLEHLDLSGNHIKWIHPQAFDSLGALKFLNLGRNLQLGYSKKTLPPRLFEKLKSLETLWIQGNSDDSKQEAYPNDALAKLSNLRSLFIDGLGGGVEFGPQMDNLTRLQKLVFGFYGRCQIQKLSSTFFQHTQRLRDLEFFGCNIQNIDPTALTKLHSLKNYSIVNPKSAECGFCSAFQSLQGLQNSPLESLAFVGFTGGRTKCLTLSGSYSHYIQNLTLKYLYLNFNDISVIDGEFLENIPDSIERLNFRGNKFTFADSRWNYLQKLTKLNHIDVREQNVYPREMGVEDPFRSRDVLTSYNGVEDVDDLYSPVSVDLQDKVHYAKENQNGKVSPCVNKALDCKHKLERTFLKEDEIHLETNDTTKYVRPERQCDPIHEVCIPPNLRELRASGFSQFGSVLLFQKLFPNRLCYLDFSRGFLNNWGHGRLPETVMTADFSDNFCNALSSKFFPVKNKLQNLCIQNNQLGAVLARDYHGKHFANLRDLSYLNIAMNNIYELSPSLFQGLKNLKSLIIAENKLYILDLNFTFMRQLRFVDLSKNTISWITKKSRQHLDELAKDHNIGIDLCDNPLPCTCNGIEILQWLNQTKVNLINQQLLECTNEKEDRFRMWPIDKTLQLLQERCQAYSLIPCILGSVVLLLSIIACVLTYRHRWKLIYAVYIHLTRRYGYKPVDVSSSQHTYDAFVVYCEDDRAFALDTIIEELETKRGHTLCLEDRDFIPGTLNFHNVPCAIQNSTKTVLLLSPDFLLSPESKYAIQMALLEEYNSERKRDPILLLRYTEIPDKDLTKDLLMLMKKGRLLDYPADEDEATVQRLWDRLSKEIGHTKNTNSRDVMLNSHQIVR